MEPWRTSTSLSASRTAGAGRSGRAGRLPSADGGRSRRPQTRARIRSASHRAGAAAHNVRKRIGSALAALVALVAKFGVAIKALFLALPNLKLLVTAGTALVSVAAYSLFFGWEFAAGFVVLLFVHEMGHVIALRREGIKASAPMFIPFMGAAIFTRSLGDNALAEARVGLAGPILGSSARPRGGGRQADGQRSTDRACVFRLLHQPLQPVAGGAARRRPRNGGDEPVDVVRGSRRCWSRLLFLEPGNPFLLIIVLFARLQTCHRWQQRKTRSLSRRPTTGSRRATGCSWSLCTSA